MFSRSISHNLIIGEFSENKRHGLNRYGCQLKCPLMLNRVL